MKLSDKKFVWEQNRNDLLNNAKLLVLFNFSKLTITLSKLGEGGNLN